MRVACDLSVAPSSPREAEEMASLLHEMGYGCVAVEAGEPELLKPFREAGLEAFTRATIRASSWSEVARRLRGLRADIVVVEPFTAEVARKAARSQAVSMIRLAPRMARYMDRSEAQLLASGGAAVEVSLRPLLRRGDPRRGLRGLMIIARRAYAYEAPLVLVSTASSRWELWHPRVAQALLAAMGVPPRHAMLALTAYPRAVVRRALSR